MPMSLLRNFICPTRYILRYFRLNLAVTLFCRTKILTERNLLKGHLQQKKKTAVLGKLIHPFVLSLFLEKTEKLVNSDKKFIVFDAPQLFESKANVICDYIISVTADENIRKQRIMQRDGISEEMAESRINAQLSENYFKDNSDFILENNGTKQELIDKAEGLFGYIRQVI